ncbi:Hypothetical predicted protein, partial [Mytilus galloprovincialis]
SSTSDKLPNALVMENSHSKTQELENINRSDTKSTVNSEWKNNSNMEPTHSSNVYTESYALECSSSAVHNEHYAQPQDLPKTNRITNRKKTF